MEIIDIIKLISGSDYLLAGLTYLAKKFIDKSLAAQLEGIKLRIFIKQKKIKQTLIKKERKCEIYSEE